MLQYQKLFGTKQDLSRSVYVTDLCFLGRLRYPHVSIDSDLGRVSPQTQSRRILAMQCSSQWCLSTVSTLGLV